GTVSFINIVSTFNSTVVNNGAWITDPTTNVFNSDLIVQTNGYIAAGAGDVYRFQSNFVNVSGRSNDFNTLNAKFAFDGTNTATSSGYTQQFFVAGLNMLGTNMIPVGTSSQTNAFTGSSDTPIIGFSNNFALGTLQIGNTGTNSTLELYDAFGTVGADDGKVAGLYLDTLTLFGNSLLIISNNVEVYFKNTNG